MYAGDGQQIHSAVYSKTHRAGYTTVCLHNIARVLQLFTPNFKKINVGLWIDHFPATSSTCRSKTWLLLMTGKHKPVLDRMMVMM